MTQILIQEFIKVFDKKKFIKRIYDMSISYFKFIFMIFSGQFIEIEIVYIELT